MFSQVSVCPQGEVYVPPRQTPPQADTTPRADTPQADTPWADTPPGSHPMGRHPPGQTHPWTDTPLDRQPPGRHLPRQTPTLGWHHPGHTATAADGTHPTGMHYCYCYRTWSIAVLSLLICTIAWASNFNRILESAKDCCKFYIVVWLHVHLSY